MANPVTLAAAGAAMTVGALLGLVIEVTSDTAQASDAKKFAALGTVGALRTGTRADPYAQWINDAAQACPGLPAPLLAAQLQQESGFNPNAQTPVGAQGIAQFMPASWKTWGVDANHDGVASPLEPQDAIAAQGRFMCDLLNKAKASHYGGNAIGLALAGYNAGWSRVQQYHGIPPFAETKTYVATILASEKQFTAPSTAGGPVALPAGFTLPPGTPPAVRTAVAWALKQKGGWYQYGGDCTHPLGTNPTHWCDCSSLMQKAYAAAGIPLPRTTFMQVKEGRPVRLSAPAPGDLVFAIGRGDGGTAQSPGHVAMYIGSGYLIEAPHTGARIRTVAFSSWATSSDPTAQVVAIRRITAGGG